MKITTLSKNRFSLIELLVVFAIFSILFSLIQPSFTSIREQAQSHACKNNLKTIAGAAALQLEDYDNVLNPAGYVRNTSAPQIHNPYMKIDKSILSPIGAMSHYLNPKIRYDTIRNHYNDMRKAEYFSDFKCPSNEFEEGTDFVVTLAGNRAPDNTRIFNSPRNHTSYGVNDGYLGIPNSSNQFRAAGEINRIAEPDKFMHMGEFYTNNFQWVVLAAWLEHMTLKDSYEAHTGNRLDWERHQNAMNILFTDAHVETVEFFDMDKVYTAKSIQ